ncbi:hypothetical protein [Tritonibacter scottomollicae]|uniref:hypothetical protein n=1 Tax=Tritonibacter scottomollicae TaxID=483013 RepID=UPI003AA81200
MKSKTSENIDEIAVIGVDISKDTFHLVGFDEAGQFTALSANVCSGPSCTSL